MSDSRPTTYSALAQRPTEYREAELLPAAASPLNTVAMAERMYRRYGVATPVSGKRTAIMHLREFQRTAELLMDAYSTDHCDDCIYRIDGEIIGCERHR